MRTTRSNNFSPLNDLSHRLPAYCGRDHSFNVRNVSPVTMPILLAIDIDQKARLAKFSHNREVGKSRAPWRSVFLICIALSCRTFKSSPYILAASSELFDVQISASSTASSAGCV